MIVVACRSCHAGGRWPPGDEYARHNAFKARERVPVAHGACLTSARELKARESDRMREGELGVGAGVSESGPGARCATMARARQPLRIVNGDVCRALSHAALAPSGRRQPLAGQLAWAHPLSTAGVGKCQYAHSRP